MPRKFRRVRRAGRKARRRYRKTIRKSKTTTVVVPRGPIAPRTIVRLKYTEGWQSDGTIMDFRWLINSLYDPNYTGTGHQPLGFDQYATFYARYRVFKTGYILRAVSPSGSEAYNVCIVANNVTTAFTDANWCMEQPNAITRIVSADRPLIMKGSWWLPRINGVTATQYKSDDRFQAGVTTSPTETLMMHVVYSTIGNSPSAPASAKVAFNLTLIFHCEFFDPFNVPQS